MTEQKNEANRALCLGLGIFYVAAGLWPVFHRASFEKVTGPKTDFWLVKTVGLMIASAGVALTMAALRRNVTPEIRLLANGTAASLAGIDVVYGGSGRISRIYLLDAVVQRGIVALWASAAKRKLAPRAHRRATHPPSGNAGLPPNRRDSGTFEVGDPVAG